ncbi:hypothetical protein, partial [Klebsiella pneumoniae]|uniref:hypothetical protein n=1 Tax=Klebsiella pneumoniae TaxID=573 RepID=UPI001953A663
MKFRDLDLSRLSRDNRELIKTYSRTTIAYTFTFDITETNNAGVDIGLTWPMVRGPLNLAASLQ